MVSAEEVNACLLRLSSGNHFVVDEPIHPCNKCLLWGLAVFCAFVALRILIEFVNTRIQKTNEVLVVFGAVAIAALIIIYICVSDCKVTKQCEQRDDEMDATIAQMNVEF